MDNPGDQSPKTPPRSAQRPPQAPSQRPQQQTQQQVLQQTQQQRPQTPPPDRDPRIVRRNQLQQLTPPEDDDWDDYFEDESSEESYDPNPPMTEEDLAYPGGPDELYEAMEQVEAYHDRREAAAAIAASGQPRSPAPSSSTDSSTDFVLPPLLSPGLPSIVEEALARRRELVRRKQLFDQRIQALDALLHADAARRNEMTRLLDRFVEAIWYPPVPKDFTLTLSPSRQKGRKKVARVSPTRKKVRFQPRVTHGTDMAAAQGSPTRGRATKKRRPTDAGISPTKGRDTKKRRPANEGSPVRPNRRRDPAQTSFADEMIPGPPPKRQRSGSHRQNTNLPDVEAPREESQIPDVIESPDKESKNPDTIETPKGDAKLSKYMAMPQRKKPKILIINPNTSKELTETMKRAVADANPKMHIDWYTAKEGPGSIDTNEDAQRSAEYVMKEVTSELSKYDGFLVACYCEHPLLEFLRTELPSAETPVLGIFKASIDAAMSIVSRDNSPARFGIVTNGEYWETVLHNGVKAYLGPGRYGAKFSGVKSACIMVDKLQAMKAEEVAKIEAAVRWFLDDISISVIIMGCASMSGLEGVFEKALGTNATGVQILDGVKCGIRELEKLLMTTREIIEKDPIEYWLEGVERAGEEEDGELDKKDLDGVEEVGSNFERQG